MQYYIFILYTVIIRVLILFVERSSKKFVVFEINRLNANGRRIQTDVLSLSLKKIKTLPLSKQPICKLYIIYNILCAVFSVRT